MRYTAEQHLRAARHNERRANTTKDPARKAALKEAAKNSQAVALAARTLLAKSLTRDALAKAALSARLSSGKPFDEKTYAKALPYFKAGVRRFAGPGLDMPKMVKHLVRYLAQNGMNRAAIANMRPYVRRFIEDETRGGGEG